MTSWLLRLSLMIIGVGLGIAVTAGTARADSTPLGKGVEKVLGDVKKASESVVKKKTSQARPQAVRKPVRRPAAKPAKRVVRTARAQAEPVRISAKPRVRISSPVRKKAVAPARSRINKARPAKIVKRAPAKIHKPVAKKIDKPGAKKAARGKKKINKPATKARSVDVPAIRLPSLDPPAIKVPALELSDASVGAIRLPDVVLPALELPTVTLPAVDLPELAVPPLPVPPGVIPPVQSPPVEPEVPASSPERPVEIGRQPTIIRSADWSVSPAADHVHAVGGQVETAAAAPPTAVRSVVGALAAKMLRSVDELLGETSSFATPTSVGAGAALVAAASFGQSASSSARGSTSGWAGMALLPATFHLCAVGARRRFSAALRLSAWRITYRPAFAPD